MRVVFGAFCANEALHVEGAEVTAQDFFYEPEARNTSTIIKRGVDDVGTNRYYIERWWPRGWISIRWGWCQWRL